MKALSPNIRPPHCLTRCWMSGAFLATRHLSGDKVLSAHVIPALWRPLVTRRYLLLAGPHIPDCWVPSWVSDTIFAFRRPPDQRCPSCHEFYLLLRDFASASRIQRAGAYPGCSYARYVAASDPVSESTTVNVHFPSLPDWTSSRKGAEGPRESRLASRSRAARRAPSIREGCKPQGWRCMA